MDPPIGSLLKVKIAPFAAQQVEITSGIDGM
jgi:hypothetical protein